MLASPARCWRALRLTAADLLRGYPSAALVAPCEVR